MQLLILACLGRLAVHRPHLTLHFHQHIGHAEKVRFGVFQLSQGFLFLGLTLGDPGGFFENLATVLRFRTEEHVDFPLLHDRVGAAAHPGIHEHFVNIFQAAGGAVHFILAFSVPIDPAGDTDFIKIDPKAGLTI